MGVPMRSLTEFLQHSGQALSEIEEGELVLKRRQGDDLIVLSRPHWDAVVASLRLLAETRENQVRQRVEEEIGPPTVLSLPWLALLEPQDRALCIRELTTTAVTAVETGKLRPLAETLDAWRATALAAWDDRRNRERSGYAEDAPLPLSRP